MLLLGQRKKELNSWRSVDVCASIDVPSSHRRSCHGEVEEEIRETGRPTQAGRRAARCYRVAQGRSSPGGDLVRTIRIQPLRGQKENAGTTGVPGPDGPH